ncbi:hypothetical protein OC834_005111 [Tilletia horrida]|nr:hypothetical protein OC834_005111 [Tilletia horrida]
MSTNAGPVDIEAAPAAVGGPPPPTQPAPVEDTDTSTRKAKKKPKPEPPECVKALQRCAARLDEWERNQAAIARQREYQTSPPDKPEPLLHRFITVPIVAIILSWVGIVYLWRIVYPALAGHANALATRGEGIGLCAGFCVLYLMTLWSWITAVVKQPGYAKDFVPQSDPPPTIVQTTQPYPRPSFQEPILYNGPVSPRPDAEVIPGQKEGEADPPGILAAALPIASAATDVRKESDDHGMFGTSARSGAGTDITAVSRSGQLGKSFDGPALDKDEPYGEQEPASPTRSNRTRSASIASSLTGLPPSPRPHTDAPLPDEVGNPAGDAAVVPLPPADRRASDESDAMPGGLPAHAREYDWEGTHSAVPGPSASGAANSNSAAHAQYTTFPPPPPSHFAAQPPPPTGPPPFLPIPQRYPKVTPLLGELNEVPSRYCHWCKIVKPPRAHHCKKCGACVLKMDHHCPWVGGCVGALNYRFFLIFVMWVSALEVFVLVSNAVLFHRGVKRTGLPDLAPQRRWSIDGFMISLFPICAIFGIFTLTLLSVHIYLLVFNLSTIEQLAYASHTNGEDAVLDGWMRQTVEKRRTALEQFDRAGGWSMLVRNQRAQKGKNGSGRRTKKTLPPPATSSEATAVQHEEVEEQTQIARLRKRAEEMLLVSTDYASCGLFLPHKAFLRQHFLDGGPWGEERTEGNAWWIGGSAEHGAAWDRLRQLHEERDTAEVRAATATGELCSKEGRPAKGGAGHKREAEIRRLERRIRGRPAPLGLRLGAAGQNAKQVFGTRPWEWFLPIGQPAHDGLSFPLNPRFAPDGSRRTREQWPAALR